MTPGPASSPSGAPPAYPPPTRWEIFGWCCFDFANSSFTTVISTVVYSVYFTEVVAKGRDNALSLWAICGAAAQFLVVVLGPFLGALADYMGRKKAFLGATALGCVLPTALLYYTGAGDVALSCGLVALATLCFSLGENFTASFLPELSTPENAGRISGYGWAFGYFGGLISLALSVLLQRVDVRLVFPGVALFFLLAALPTFLLLRERAPRRPAPALGRLLSHGWGSVWQYLLALPSHPALLRLLVSFLLYMMGVTAVIQFAGIYASQELGYTGGELAGLFLLLQLAAAAGAFAFGWLQDRWGGLSTLALSLVGWIGVSAGAWASTDKASFAAVAVLAGAVIGATQSASRALVSQLTPPGQPAETFAFWGLFGKLAAILGPVAFGLVSDRAGIRLAILLTGVFFLAGLVGLGFMRQAQARPAPTAS